MPNWKKVIVSGSDATLSSVIATTGFTGSLQGTASYALDALSASYAPSLPTFPYTGSAIISGSLTVTGSLFVQDFGKTNIDSSTRQLYDAGPVMPPNAPSVLSIDWGSRTLNDRFANASVDWGQRAAYDNTTVQSINWDSRQLTSPNSNVALDWADNTILNSNAYQRDFKSAATQDAVSTNYNNPSTSYLGDVIEVDGVHIFIDSAVTDGMLVYLEAGVWYPVSQASLRATYLLGIAHNVGSNAGFVLLEGHVVIDTSTSIGPYVANADYGLPIYIEDSTTTGTMSTVVPTTTGLGSNIIRILGHCYQQNGGAATQWIMKFRPSNDWVEI